jgi:hypothetical protein
MKLNELNSSLLSPIKTATKDKLPNNVAIDSIKGTYSRLLTDNGWKRVSSGLYANIYSIDGYQWYLKIFESRDVCYKSFVEFVKENPNKHFPKFRGSIVQLNNKFSAIRVEPLQLLDGKEANNYYKYGLLLNNFEGDFTGVNPIINGMPVKKFEKEHASICDAIKLLHFNFATTKCHYDMHMDNIMSRNGVPVIIDPYSTGT